MLLDDVLIVDQVTSMFRDNFAVTRGDGAVLGRIQTEGGLGRRMLMGNREFSVYDNDGARLIQLVDVPNLGRDRFDVIGQDGARMAEVVKEISFFKPRLTVRLGDGQQLDVRGDFFDFNYEIDHGPHRVAQVSRRWPGLAQSLLGRDRYVIAYAPQVPGAMRLAVLGLTISLDLIRAKDRRKSD